VIKGAGQSSGYLAHIGLHLGTSSGPEIEPFRCQPPLPRLGTASKYTVIWPLTSRDARRSATTGRAEEEAKGKEGDGREMGAPANFSREAGVGRRALVEAGASPSPWLVFVDGQSFCLGVRAGGEYLIEARASRSVDGCGEARPTRGRGPLCPRS
jgi:hypothetical protein